jgi:predicted secreted protein
MSIVSAIVLFLVIWFMVMFVALPFREQSQAEAGEIEPGTHAGAPANFNLGRKVKLVTMISAVLWVLIAGVIFSGVISVRDFDFMGVMGPEPVAN